MTVSHALPVPGTANFRDLGGYPTVDGRRTRLGVVYRSDGLAHLGEAGREALRGLGIRTVIDLRDDTEVNLMPDDLAGLDVTVRRNPLFQGSLDAQAAPGSSLDGMYADILTTHGSVVATVLREIVAAEAAPAVVHCTAGKDRTGVVSALVLLTAGVPLDLVLDDYAATAANLAGPWVEKMTAAAAAHGIAVTPQLIALMSASPRSALQGALSGILAAEGGLEAYLDGIGFGAEDRERLRGVLVEPAA